MHALALFALLSFPARGADSLSFVKADEPPARIPLSCADAKSIRAFKTVVMAELVGSRTPGQEAAAAWGRCVCGQASDLAGFDELPADPERVPAKKACTKGMERVDCAKRDAVEYFKPNLPVSDEQALRLALCSWGLVAAPTAPPPPKPAAAPPPAAPRKIEWVDIPAGKFMMGGRMALRQLKSNWPQPHHMVHLKAFQISRGEVTVAQYRECVKAGACTEPEPDKIVPLDCNYPNPGRDDHPVNCVSWNQAAAFAAWAKARLPSEAEWEYVARSAGKYLEYPWAGDARDGCKRAVFWERRSKAYGCGTGYTWPICSKPEGSTEQGVCDMMGNIAEWVQDRMHYQYAGAPTDGSAWETPGDPEALKAVGEHPKLFLNDRVVRGGSFADKLSLATTRGSWPMDRTYWMIGFRVAR